MKTIVIAAVNSENSINLELSQKISFLGEYDLINLNDLKENIPILSNDLIEQGIPEGISQLNEQIILAKNIIIVTPEHNGYFSAFFKNILDWLTVVNKKIFGDKNLILVIATPSAKGGLSLRQIASKSFIYMGAISFESFGFCEYSPEKDFNQEINQVIEHIDSLD